MGVGKLGYQTALGREVAVKMLRPEHRDERATLKLLREAWVTGGLDHPNVVTVHDIAAGADGSPWIVLKRIEGVTWASLMHEEQTVRVATDRYHHDERHDQQQLDRHHQCLRFLQVVRERTDSAQQRGVEQVAEYEVDDERHEISRIVDQPLP
jgi:hypothetical protein